MQLPLNGLSSKVPRSVAVSVLIYRNAQHTDVYTLIIHFSLHHQLTPSPSLFLCLLLLINL